jgi:hypothetical protein
MLWLVLRVARRPFLSVQNLVKWYGGTDVVRKADMLGSEVSGIDLDNTIT